MLPARKSGLALLGAETDLFGFCDSDDALMSGAVDTLVRAFEETGDQYSQVIGWCCDPATGKPSGTMARQSGPGNLRRCTVRPFCWGVLASGPKRPTREFPIR